MAQLISGIVCAGLSVGAPGVALAQAGFDLIGLDLSRLPIRLTEITGERVVWSDPTGDTAVVPVGDVLGLAARGLSRAEEETGGVLSALRFEPSMLRLTDGRRLTGSLSAQEDLPETLRWQHPVLGRVDVPLEQIDRLVLQRATVGAGTVELLPIAEQDDVILLRNGDRLEGFVAGLGRDAVIEVDGRSIAVPMETVHQVALANPRERWRGPMVWLRDGSVLGAAEVRFDGAAFVLIDDTTPATEADDTEGSAQSVTIRPEHVSAVSFDTRRLVPVSSLLGGAAGVGEPGAFGARAITLDGRASVGVELPGGASRLALTAELPLRARAWGRCELLLSTDGVVRARLPMSAATPVIDYELDLDGASTLELTLEPGEFGRVHSVVEVRDALIAVE